MAAEAAADEATLVAEEYDGESAAAMATRLGVPGVALYRRIASTMDAAHSLGAAGAPGGSLVLADEQTAGRGRQGTSWSSPPTHGVWLTLLERPASPAALEVVSLRVGMAAARALEPFAAAAILLKWPNDLFVRSGKVAGVLLEARWRGERPDWLAVGVGVNVLPPVDVPRAAGLRGGTSRLDVLASLVPAVRAATAMAGPLDPRELDEFALRDYARGRRCVAPVAGVVAGVTSNGELAVDTAGGLRYHRAGSLVLEEGA